ncbi:MAG: hypothetical protein HRU38_23320 [Saccharospirillaceae bacterium]|nr:hypothetical protein [Saccharospirillaceae bacterium]
MEKYSARISKNMTASSLRRGFDDLCILIKREEDILPPEELMSAYQNRRKQLEAQRQDVFLAMDSPNKSNLNKFKGREQYCERVKNPYILAVFFEIGDRIAEINLEMNQINKVTRKKGELKFSQIFMGVASKVLDKAVFEDIHVKTRLLEHHGFLGTSDEWAEFVSTLK